MFVGPIHVTHNDKRRINFSYRKALTAANLFLPLKNIKKKRWRDAGLSAGPLDKDGNRECTFSGLMLAECWRDGPPPCVVCPT
jgi:hypothetical protein